MNKFIKKLPIIIYYLLRLSVILSFLTSLWQKNWINAVAIFGILILIFLPTYIKNKLKIIIPFEFELIAVAFIYLAVFLGDLRDFYYIFWWWDVYLHLVSGLLFGIIGFALIYILNDNKNIKLTMQTKFVALFALLFAVSMGVFWELFEFGMDSFLGTNMQRSGLPDTMWDLLMDVTGAFMISLWGYFWMKGKFKIKFFDNYIKKFMSQNK